MQEFASDSISTNNSMQVNLHSDISTKSIDSIEQSDQRSSQACESSQTIDRQNAVGTQMATPVILTSAEGNRRTTTESSNIMQSSSDVQTYSQINLPITHSTTIASNSDIIEDNRSVIDILMDSIARCPSTEGNTNNTFSTDYSMHSTQDDSPNSESVDPIVDRSLNAWKSGKGQTTQNPIGTQVEVTMTPITVEGILDTTTSTERRLRERCINDEGTNSTVESQMIDNSTLITQQTSSASETSNLEPSKNLSGIQMDKSIESTSTEGNCDITDSDDQTMQQSGGDDNQEEDLPNIDSYDIRESASQGQTTEHSTMQRPKRIIRKPSRYFD